MKIIIYILMCICCIGNVAAGYDEEFMIDLWGLGDLRNDSPLNFYDFTVNEDNAQVKISYVGDDCENENDFFMYITGINEEINCSGNGNNKPITESRIYNLDSGTYELNFDYNRDNAFRISDVFIQIEYPENNNGNGDSGSGTIVENTVNVESSTFGDINDYFNEQSFFDYISIQIGAYFLALLCIFIYKIGDITNRRFKRGINY